MTTTATPTKLRDGSWGCKTAGTAKIGDIVTITTRSGKSWDAKITRVVRTGADEYGDGDEISICATESLDRPVARTSTRSRSANGICRLCGSYCYGDCQAASSDY